MKVKELIDQLNKLVKKHGENLEIFIQDPESGWYDSTIVDTKFKRHVDNWTEVKEPGIELIIGLR